VAAIDDARRISVAPMMDWTDRHCRAFHRVLTRRSCLYTEMVTAAALQHGDRQRLLAYSAHEHPLALQLGGSEPAAMAEAAHIAEAEGYQEVNINVGCPSDRVQQGRFGACLMAEPDLVARCFEAMQTRLSIPVTVKTRIGIDDQDSPQFLHRFVRSLVDAGCRVFIVHARKAILSGLSPKQNRTIPPLDYQRVYDLKQAFPDLQIILNGGITNLEEIDTHLQHLDGVMLGRVAYQNPYLLADMDRRYFGERGAILSRQEAVETYLPYVQSQLEAGERLHSMTRHMLGLFTGQPGARAWRRLLREEANKPSAGVDVLQNALNLVLQQQAA